MEIEWETFDADGDELSVIVLISDDGGFAWSPLVLNYSGEQFSFIVPKGIATDEALIRVMVSDGINTSEDVSDATFCLSGPSCFVCRADYDLNGDDEQDSEDLLLLIGDFHRANLRSDFNCDGIVSYDDLLMFSRGWNAISP